MPMKLVRLFLSLALTLLSAASLRAGEDGPLRFDSPAHDFGTIREQDGRVSHTFRFVNTGNSPAVITAVETSCGCTVADFSKRPVMPGQSGEITITYDPGNRPGVFTRDVDVYTADRRRAARLRIEGSVEPRPRSIEETYPVDAGAGLRLTATFIPFSYVSHGMPKQSYIGCINTSDKPVRLAVKIVKGSGLMSVVAPARLEPGQRAEIGFIYSVAEGSDIYRTAGDAAEISVDGQRLKTRISTDAIIVGNYDPEAAFPAPQAHVSKNNANFGTVKRSSGVRRIPVKIANNGGEPLRIDGFETQGAVSLSLRRGTIVDSGEDLSFDIILRPSAAQYGFLSQRIRLFTNDPVRPMRQIHVTAAIED